MCLNPMPSTPLTLLSLTLLLEDTLLLYMATVCLSRLSRLSRCSHYFFTVKPIA